MVKESFLIFLFSFCFSLPLTNCYEPLTRLEASALNPAIYPQLIDNLNAKLAVAAENEDKSSEEEKPTGELSAKNKCLHRLHFKMENGITTALSGLVGVGWDDLTNKITLPIFPTKYLKCKTTPDGHFLLPDNVLAIPIQEVIIDRTAKSYKSYNDIEKESIKASRDEGFVKYVGGGSYASGNQEIKKIFSNGQTSMLEANIGYKAFTFIAEPNEGLDPIFHDKIEEIIKSYQNYLPYLALYQAECLIRDYGTHVVNKVLTGAMIRYRIFVKKDEKHTHMADVKTSQSEHSVNILGIFGTDGKGETKEEKAKREAFEENVQYSFIETKGGPDVRSILGAGSEKSMMRMDNLVGLEHEGVPIYSVIHGSYFPNYNSSLLLAVQDLITNATKMYYEKNTAVGCMDPNFPNYDYTANFHNDDSCNATENTLVFNGFFQRCEYLKTKFFDNRGTWYNDVVMKQYDLCPSLTIDHPAMPSTSCPENYDSVLLLSNVYESPRTDVHTMTRNCPDNFFTRTFKGCSTSEQRHSFVERAQTNTYWCRRKEGAPTTAKGLPFGGVFYREDGENVFTNTKGCPEYYTPYQFFGSVYICINLNNNNLGAKNAIDFGGFYSCHSKTKTCPSGFTAHLLTIYNGCPVHCCVHPLAFNKAQENPLKRPPFSDFHKAINNQTSDDKIPKPGKLNNETLKTLEREFNVTNLKQNNA
uniref:Macrophage-expressed gene 1 protein n=1 Tax=Panagrolaimus davidi TaxID=227884 RepID=A0A914QZK3_9BILA